MLGVSVRFSSMSDVGDRIVDENCAVIAEVLVLAVFASSRGEEDLDLLFSRLSFSALERLYRLDIVDARCTIYATS
jgi:hypothetical protein